MSTTDMEGPTTEERHLAAVTNEDGTLGPAHEPIVSPEQMKEQTGETCPAEGCGKTFKNRKSLSMHMRNQHGMKLDGTPIAKKQASAKKQKAGSSGMTEEQFSGALGKLIFPNGIHPAAPAETLALVDTYANLCSDAYKLYLAAQ